MGRNSFDAVIATSVPNGWRLGFRLRDGLLDAVDFLPARMPLRAPTGPQAEQIADLLDEYFRDPLVPLNTLHLTSAPTPFQDRVRQRMLAIPIGQTRTYGELARQLQTAPRAVAGACRANPIALVVPCHRVVSASGPGGFMGALGGAPLELKAWLLKHESL